MSNATTACSQTVRESASACSSPPTPKPLDYRSESKRRATVEVTDGNSVKDQTDSENAASQVKTQPIGEADTNSSVPSGENYQEPEPPEKETPVLPDSKVIQDDQQPSHSNSRSFQSLPLSSHFLNDLPGPSRSRQFENWPAYMNPDYRFVGSSSDSASSSMRHHNYPYCPPVNASLYDSHALARKWWANQKDAMGNYMGATNFHEDVSLCPGNEWSYGSVQNYSSIQQNQGYDDHYQRRQQAYPRSYMQSMHNRPYKSSFRANRFSWSREQGNLQSSEGQKYLPCGVAGNPFSQEKSTTVHGHRRHTSGFGKGKPGRVFQSLSKNNVPFMKKKKRLNRKFMKDLRRPQSAGAVLMHSTSSISSRLAKLTLKKKKEKKDAPEDPNKKAFTAAADKLRKTFFASKKTSPEDGNSKDHRKQTTMQFHSTQENAEDLSIKTYARSCHFGSGLRVIDVTEKENMKTLPTPLASPHFQEGKAPSSNLKYKQSATCNDASDETSDEEVEEKKQPSKTTTTQLQRRRYLSESAGAACATGCVRPPRSRSTSVGAIDSSTCCKRTSSNQEKSTTPDRPRVNKMLVKQLLTMDKKSLQDLVADPRSRKAQFMVSHLMSEQRSALAQRLDMLRGQQGPHSKTRALSCELSQELLIRDPRRMGALEREEELQILGQIEALELETLSSDVLFQVRQILLAEQQGLASQTIAQAFLSIDDLLSGQISDTAQPQLSRNEASIRESVSKPTTSAGGVASKEPLQLTCAKLPLLSPPAIKLTSEANFPLLSQNAMGLQKPSLLVQSQVDDGQEQNLSTRQHDHESDHVVEMKTLLGGEAAIQSPAVAVHSSEQQQQQSSTTAVTSEQIMNDVCLPKASSASLGTDLRTHQAIERSLNSPKVQDTSLLPECDGVKSELAHHDLDISFETSKEVDEGIGNKSVSSDMECQIVSPPPKLPPAMITIDDSDPEEVKNFTKSSVAVQLENDENSLPIDVENDSQCDNQSSLGFTPIEEPSSVFRAPLPHQIISPQARSLSSLHFNIGPPLSRVDPITVSASAVSSHSLPMSLVPPVDNRDNGNSVIKQTLSLDSYATATLTKSSCGTTEQQERQLPHPLASAQDTLNVSVTRSSSPLPVIMMPDKQVHMNSCNTPEEPKPCIVSKMSPPSTPPCQHLPSSIADQRSTSHVFLPSTQDLQLPGTLKTKTSPPVTPPLIHPSSSLFRSPPNLPRPDKTDPAVSTSPSPLSCSPGDSVNRVLLHGRIATRPLMPPPPVQPQPPSLHNVHLHTGGLHRNLDLSLASMQPQLAGVNDRDSSGRRAPPPPSADSLDSLGEQPHGGVVAGAGRLELRPSQPRQLVPPPADATGAHGTASTRQTVKVKEETPSPQLECHLCQHLHHSPHSPQHSPQCCPYTPSPAPSVPPRPPPPMPPAHSPPSQASPAPQAVAATSGLLAPLYQRTSKQEQPLHGGSYLCENVNRPSSKERPRNPAPPNTPHRIPSPAVLPTPPRPVIFPNDPEIPERPAPPHPPAPPQSLGNTSPRIKLERHTPSQSYPCCCLRNECNRSSSRASMDGSNSRSGMRSSPSPLAAVPSLAPSNTASGSTVGRLWFFTPSIPDQATGSSHVNILTNHDTGHGHLHHHRHHHLLHHNHHSHPLETAAPSKIMKRERLTPCISGAVSGSRHHGVWLSSEPKADPSEPAASVAVAPSLPPRNSTDSSIRIPSKSTSTSGFVSVAVQTQARDNNKNSNDILVDKTADQSTSTGRVDQGTSTDECTGNNSPENNNIPDHASIVPTFMRTRFTRRGACDDTPLTGLRVSRSRYRQNNVALNDTLPSDSRLFRSQAPVSALPAQCFVEELCRLSTIEEILLKDVKDVDRKAEELMQQRSNLMAQLMQLQQERSDWMMQLISDGTTARMARHGRCSVPVMPFLDNLDRSEGTATAERISPDRNHRGESSQELADSSISLVSSSQENGPSPHDARVDAQEPVADCSIQRQRCTSTSHSPGMDRSFSKHRDLLEVSEPVVYPDETNSDSDGDVSMKPAPSLASGESPSTSLNPVGKSKHFVYSSIDDDSNTEVRVTRRRSKSISDGQEDPNSSKGDEDDNKDCIARLSVPDTTEESAENNLCVVHVLSAACKVEFNVCRNEDCPPDSLAQSCLLDQQSSHPDVPTKIFLQSPKSRNSSGSDHSYSLRSRGPPEGEKAKRCQSVSQLDAKDEPSLTEDISSPDNTTIELDKDLVDDEQTEDDGIEEEDAQSQSLSAASSLESLDSKTACSDLQTPQHRHKRKRRSRKHNFGSTSGGNKRKKSNSSPNSDKCDKKTLPLASPSSRRKISVDPDHRDDSLCPGSGKKKQRIKALQNRSPECGSKPVVVPPQLKEAVLDMKVVGNYLFTCSSSSIQCFDLLTGRTAATYACDKRKITALAVIGVPCFVTDSPAKKLGFKDDCVKSDESKEARGDGGKAESQSLSKLDAGGSFEVITGASDGSLRVYNGQKGTVEHVSSVEGAVCCLAVAWDQVFAAALSGHTSRWSYKSGATALEMVNGCPEGVNFLVCHREGCRRVLVMAGRQSPIVIRDAFSGLLLRSLEVVQNSVYRVLFVGGQLYTAGSRSIVLYDYASGEKKQKLNTESDVSSLAASSQYLLACCYDSCVRVYCRQTGELVKVLKIETNHKLLISSAVFRHTILVGSKGGEIVPVDFSR